MLLGRLDSNAPNSLPFPIPIPIPFPKPGTGKGSGWGTNDQEFAPARFFGAFFPRALACLRLG
jgi:hypothetical protein